VAQEEAYGDPPLSGTQQLTPAYVNKAEADVAVQLSRAGVRLAHMLNQALK
jgi:hypothetical protein